MNLLLSVIAFTLFWCSYGQADANKVVYELQERCGKTADEIFKKEHGSGISSDKNGGSMIVNYTNHYNVKLNKCFMLLNSISVQKGSKDKRGALVIKTLGDIHENKEYGNFVKFQNDLSPSNCTVGERKCSSEKEWDALVKPYMEE